MLKQLEQLRTLVAKLCDEELSQQERDALNDLLRESPALRREYASLLNIHANLITHPALPGAKASTPPRRIKPLRLALTLGMAAGLVAMLAFIFTGQEFGNRAVATLTSTNAAHWEDSDLPTSVGSRLEPGTIRLASGLATIEFDSGALVTIEAPATLTLVDTMNCTLDRGTAVSDIPDSAHGFTIKTPTADVVDYGTRFAVSVFEETGETLTQVMEGKVQVEYAASDKIVELTTGQRDQVLGEAPDAAKLQEHRTLSNSPRNDFGPEWKLLRTSKDAYTGRVPSHESDTMLYVKNPHDGRGPARISNGLGPTRVSWLGFDLRQVEKERIEEAELLLQFAPTGFGLASFVPDAEFGVYGLVGKVPEWDESIQNRQFPKENQVIPLGSFVVPHGVQEGQFRVSTEALAKFLRGHPDSEITLKVVRETKETEDGGLVHGFASRRHPFLPAPTLAIRQKAQ